MSWLLKGLGAVLMVGVATTLFTHKPAPMYHGVIVRTVYIQHSLDPRWLVTTDQGYSCTFYVRNQPGLAVGDSIYGSGVRNARSAP